jgi:hypothetical protein
MIRHAPERRYRERLLWMHPVLMEAELDDSPRWTVASSSGGLRRVRAAAGLPAGAAALRRPESAPLLHPGCAMAVAEGMLRDAREIEEEEL